mgnify:CR=1 FL=1
MSCLILQLPLAGCRNGPGAWIVAKRVLFLSSLLAVASLAAPMSGSDSETGPSASPATAAACPINQEDKTARAHARLARKADLARAARRRKKDYVQDLENKLRAAGSLLHENTRLKEEVQRLREQLQKAVCSTLVCHRMQFVVQKSPATTPAASSANSADAKDGNALASAQRNAASDKADAKSVEIASSSNAVAAAAPAPLMGPHALLRRRRRPQRQLVHSTWRGAGLIASRAIVRMLSSLDSTRRRTWRVSKTSLPNTTNSRAI